MRIPVWIGALARTHDAGPSHVDTAWRIDAIERCLAACDAADRRVSQRLATRDDLLLAHEAGYVDHVLALRGVHYELDPETALGPFSVDAARNAAGATLELVEWLLLNERPGVAVVRPPGHHAGRASAMGYCVFNNVAIGARYAQRLGAHRVAIVDWDVHHGNGTEEIVRGDTNTLFVSVHQAGLFPSDTGGVEAAPVDSTDGHIVNIPLEPGGTDADYVHVFRSVVVPRLLAFRPDLVLVSAGFDACAGDPEGGMRMSPAGFGTLAALLAASAGRVCGSRLGLVLEGGYDLNTLGDCVAACVRGLSRDMSTASLAV